jgi:Glycosyl transferase family 2
MRCPRLHDLPPPPPSKTGWPWTEESTPAACLGTDGKECPRITIVTPSFNQGRFLEETIRSVLLQGYGDLEYFVLDGGSTDDSVAIIKKYSSWLTCWKSEPDGGQSNAINRGLTMGSGAFATWINSDDLLCQNALVNHVSQNGSDPNTVYVGVCLYLDANGKVISSHRGRVHCLEDLVRIRDVWRCPTQRGHIVQPEVLFPRELALAVGGLDPMNHFTMDYNFWGKLLLAGAQFRYTDIPFGMFREHGQQKTRDMLRQTRSLIDTAVKLVLQADSFSQETTNEILAELRSYQEEYEVAEQRDTGRLARLGLPRGLVVRLRKLRATLHNAVPFRASANKP